MTLELLFIVIRNNKQLNTKLIANTPASKINICHINCNDLYFILKKNLVAKYLFNGNANRRTVSPASFLRQYSLRHKSLSCGIWSWCNWAFFRHRRHHLHFKICSYQSSNSHSNNPNDQVICLLCMRNSSLTSIWRHGMSEREGLTSYWRTGVEVVN